MSFFEIALLPIGGKREKKTFDTLKNLSSTVVKSVKKFQEGVSAYSHLEYEKGEKILHEVDKLESEADEYGYQFESELGGGAFLPAFRGDLSKLAESIDDIADRAEESIREIYRRPRTFKDLAKAEEKDAEVKNIRLGLAELAGKAVSSAEALNKAVSVLMDNMEEASEIAEEVHRREHESDDKENEIAILLYEKEDLIRPVTVMQIRGLINRFGAISDAAEASGDTLSAMTNALKV